MFFYLITNELDISQDSHIFTKKLTVPICFGLDVSFFVLLRKEK